MPVLNPDHLLEQAEKLVRPPQAGPPRQADVRRAISAAYYAVFHALLTAASDEFVGKRHRATGEYALMYRSISHQRVSQLCASVASGGSGGKMGQYTPVKGFGDNLQSMAAVMVELQERRHEADYDPLVRVRTADAMLAVRSARSALRRFAKATPACRKRFLALLLFQPR